MIDGPLGTRLADRVLGRFLSREDVDDLTGDLAEEYRRHILPTRGRIGATMWYWQQVIRSIPSSASRRRSRPSPSGDGPIMHLLHDTRLAIRSLLRTPGFTTIAVLTLGLGIGANTTIFSVVQTVLLRPLPYDEPDRIVEIWETHPERGWNTMSFSHPNFWDMWEQNDSFEELAGLTGAAMNLTGFEYPQRLAVRQVSAGFFRVLRLQPLHGRTFVPGEDHPGNDNRVALLGHGFWMSRFGGDPGVVGRTITLDGEPYTVVGVLPDLTPFPGETDVYIPFVRGTRTLRSDHRLFVTGRLKAGVSVEAAQADLENIAAGIGNQDEDGALGVRIAPSSEWIAGPQLRVALWVLMGAVAFLLLIACVNLANLLLARATGRQRETAVCAALGASRGRLATRMLAESTILGVVGAALGIALAVLGIRLVHAFNPGNIPRIDEIAINTRVLGFTLVTAVLTGMVTGLVPALQTPYGSLLTSLRDGDRGVAGNRGQHRTRSALVAAEAALSLMLLTGAGLMIRSFGELQGVDTGFDPENRVSFQVSLPGSYGSEQVETFLKGFLSRVEEVPTVRAAGAVNMLPIAGGSVGMGIATEDRMHDASAVTWVDWRLVTPSYFRTMGLPLVRGRDMRDDDQQGTPWKVVISQPLAELLWPGEDPIGRRAALWVDPDRIAEVVGVVGGMRERGPQQDETMVVYIPYYGASWSPLTFVVHTAGEPAGVVPLLRTLLAEVDPDLPLSNISTLDELVDGSVSGNRFNMLLLGIFAAVALLLALAGIYGVLAYSVSRRTNEIGVRVALGASQGNVLGQVVLQGMRPVALGIGIGLVGAVGLSRFLSTLLFGIPPTDPITYGSVSLLLAAAALGACYLPARRALHVDPVTALREE